MAISWLYGMAKWIRGRPRNRVNQHKCGHPVYWRFWLEYLEKRELLSSFVVINTNDSGAGSLRQAILNANANNGLNDTINFNIPGAGLHTISPASALPTITDAQVKIDGSSQPGYVFDGRPLIQLDGSSAGSFVDGLDVAAANATIIALAIDDFNGSGLSCPAAAFS